MRGQARGPGERQAKKGTTHLPPTPGPSLLSSSFLPAFSRPSPCTQSLCPRHPHPCLSTISLTLRSLPKPQALLESLPPLPSFLCILGSPKSQTKFYLGLSLPPSPSISARLYLLKPVPSRAPPGVPACPHVPHPSAPPHRSARTSALPTAGLEAPGVGDTGRRFQEAQRRRHAGLRAQRDSRASHLPAGLGADDGARRGNPRGAPLSPRGHGG